ncbi:hypothetical protein L0P52_05130 [Clostridium cochlearium]|uniref:hypothetical protein n=1 Tax=Clostridium cochlearium TaxID=1494 RepID=UPI001EE05D72|nr:hypothetical protein [Clostridium cochlearium]MBV1821033.1 hypothetical protein [Bacteroidales bacterium MSK.15.36]MCG4571620.1 hypothetical protein [Clostridium cochlearium]
MDLRTYLEKFRDVTLDVIDAFKKEDYELGNDLLDKRREVIGEIEYTIEEFRALDEEFKLLDLNKELEETIEKERIKIRKQLDDINLRRNANNGYNTQNKSVIFSRKI